MRLLLIVVMADRAANETRFVEDLFFASGLGSLIVGLGCFFGLGHADEPVEREGHDDVENAVGPEDTFVVLVNVSQEAVHGQR